MGVTNVWTIGAVAVNGSGAFNLDGLSDAKVSPGLREFMEHPAGQPDPTYVAAASFEPVISFTCTDVSTLLANVGIGGLAIPSTTVITSVDIWFTKLAQGGTRAGTSSHLRVRVAEGMIVIRSISVQQGQAAKAQVEIYPTYDGTNDPLAYTDSQSLPHVPSVDELFTLGKVSINGTALDALQSMNIDFGIEIIKEAADGDPYLTYVAIGSRKPMLRATARNVPSLDTYGMAPVAQGSTDSVFYLRKVSKNGLRVADGTGEHISFTIDDGMWCATQAGGGNNQASDVEVQCWPTYDGSNAILVIATNATIA